MKNIATPIKEKTARDTRAQERARLNAVDVITEDQRQKLLSQGDDDAKAIRLQARLDRDAAKRADKSEEQIKNDVLEIDIAEDQKLFSLQKKIDGYYDALSNEQRDTRLQELSQEDAAFDGKYGAQPLTKEEQAQQTADKIAHDEYVRTQKYADDRAAAYPSVGEQLDALWKAIKASGVKLPADAQAVFDKVEAVKTQFPAPVKNNGR